MRIQVTRLEFCKDQTAYIVRNIQWYSADLAESWPGVEWGLHVVLRASLRRHLWLSHNSYQLDSISERVTPKFTTTFEICLDGENWTFVLLGQAWPRKYTLMTREKFHACDDRTCTYVRRKYLQSLWRCRWLHELTSWFRLGRAHCLHRNLPKWYPVAKSRQHSVYSDR